MTRILYKIICILALWFWAPASVCQAQKAMPNQPAKSWVPANTYTLADPERKALKPKIEIELYNCFGQRVKELQSGSVSTDNWNSTFDMSDISTGVYFITISGEKTFSKRFVKL